MSIASEDPMKFTNQMLLDEPYLRSKGVTDFEQCVAMAVARGGGGVFAAPSCCVVPTNNKCLPCLICVLLRREDGDVRCLWRVPRYQCVPGHEPPTLDQVKDQLMGAGDRSTATTRK